MKRVKSAIFDSVTIPDLRLVLTREVQEIPDDVFCRSEDIKKAVLHNQVICHGLPHNGKIAQLGEPTYRAMSPQPSEPIETNMASRLQALENSLSLLLKNDYEQNPSKNDDYLMYTHSFSSSDYDGLIFETFLDPAKRHSTIPGNAVIRHGNLTTANDEEIFFYGSKGYDLEYGVTEILPMAKWSGTGYLRISINAGQEITVFDNGAEDINLLMTPISVNASSIAVSLIISSKYNKIELSSYGILLKIGAPCLPTRTLHPTTSQ